MADLNSEVPGLKRGQDGAELPVPPKDGVPFILEYFSAERGGMGAIEGIEMQIKMALRCAFDSLMTFLVMMSCVVIGAAVVWNVFLSVANWLSRVMGWGDEVPSGVRIVLVVVTPLVVLFLINWHYRKYYRVLPVEIFKKEREGHIHLVTFMPNNSADLAEANVVAEAAIAAFEKAHGSRPAILVNRGGTRWERWNQKDRRRVRKLLISDQPESAVDVEL